MATEFLDLPNELIVIIFSYTDYVALSARLPDVCPFFRFIIQEHSKTLSSPLSAPLFRDTRILHGGACKRTLGEKIRFKIHPLLRLLQARTPTSDLTMDDIGFHDPNSDKFFSIKGFDYWLKECATYLATGRAYICVGYGRDHAWPWTGVRGRGKHITVLDIVKMLEQRWSGGALKKAGLCMMMRCPFAWVKPNAEATQDALGMDAPENRPTICFELNVRRTTPVDTDTAEEGYEKLMLEKVGEQADTTRAARWSSAVL